MFRRQVAGDCHRVGQLDDYLRVGVDKRGIYLETDPDGLPSLQRHVQNHTRFNAASPLWRKLEPLSDEALEEAMAPINRWIEAVDAAAILCEWNQAQLKGRSTASRGSLMRLTHHQENPL